MLLRLRDRHEVILALTLHSSRLYTESQGLKLTQYEQYIEY
jgi:hypothetical protein